MSEIEELNSLMHTFHCQGRGIEMLHHLKDDLYDAIQEEEEMSMKDIRDCIICIISLLEYKW